VQGEVMDDDLVGGGSAQLARQPIVLSHTRGPSPRCICRSTWAGGSARGNSSCGSPS
jgi:hypothetical protein